MSLQMNSVTIFVLMPTYQFTLINFDNVSHQHKIMYYEKCSNTLILCITLFKEKILDNMSFE